MQSHEEMARMREFAMKQLDRNHDSIISLEEFLGYAAGEKFEENEEWKPVVDKEEEVCVCMCVWGGCGCGCVC